MTETGIGFAGALDHASFVLVFVSLFYGMALLPWRKIRITVLSLFTLANIAFFWGNLLYFRSFHGWAGKHVFRYLDDMEAVMPSLGTLAKFPDYIFLLIIPLLCLLLVVANSKAMGWRRPYLAVPAIAVAAFFLHPVFSHGMKTDAEVNPLMDLLRQGEMNPKRISVFANHPLIGHAFGEVGGYTYTNSLEAFQKNYQKGRRIFEVDLSVTGDGEVVCFHNGTEKMFGLDRVIGYVTLKEFKKTRIYRKFTPLDLYDLVGLMKEHGDAYIVTDTKGDFGYMLREFVREAQKASPGMADRIIPQIYNERDYFQAMAVYPFPDVIYTLYKNPAATDLEVIDFIADKPNLTGLTVSMDRFNMHLSLKAAFIGKYVFVHTINNRAAMDPYIKQGAYGFYTDSYYPPVEGQGR